MRTISGRVMSELEQLFKPTWRIHILAILMSVGTFVSLVPSAFSDTLELDRKAWISTGADNSQVTDGSLFKFRKGKNPRIVTSSELTNIHSHFKSFIGKNYTYVGQFRLASSDGGIGVTFHSKYKSSDSYYRLRRYYAEPTLHIAPHGTEITDGVIDSGVTPDAGVWYKFKVLVRVSSSATRIRSKVWKAAAKEPKGWQIDCSDSSETRLKRGRVGVWSMGEGSKQWRNLGISN